MEGTYTTADIGRTPKRVVGPNPWRRRLTVQARGADAFVSSRYELLAKQVPDGLQVTRDLPAIEVSEMGELWAVASAEVEDSQISFDPIDFPAIAQDNYTRWFYRDGIPGHLAGDPYPSDYSPYGDFNGWTGNWYAPALSAGMMASGDSVYLPPPPLNYSNAVASPEFPVIAGRNYGLSIIWSVIAAASMNVEARIVFGAASGFASGAALLDFALLTATSPTDRNEQHVLPAVGLVAPVGATVARVVVRTIADPVLGGCPLVCHAAYVTEAIGAGPATQVYGVQFMGFYAGPGWGPAGIGLPVATQGASLFYTYSFFAPTINPSVKVWSASFPVEPGTHLWAQVESWLSGYTTVRYFAVEFGATASFAVGDVISAIECTDFADPQSAQYSGMFPADSPTMLVAHGTVPAAARYARITLGTTAMSWVARNLAVGVVNRQVRTLWSGKTRPGRPMPRLAPLNTFGGAGLRLAGAPLALRLSESLDQVRDIDVRVRCSRSVSGASEALVQPSPANALPWWIPQYFVPPDGNTVNVDPTGVANRWPSPLTTLADGLSPAFPVAPGETLVIEAATFLGFAGFPKWFRLLWWAGEDDLGAGPDGYAQIIPDGTLAAYGSILPTSVTVPPSASLARVQIISSPGASLDVGGLVVTRPNDSIVIGLRLFDQADTVVWETYVVQQITTVATDYRLTLTIPYYVSASDAVAEVSVYDSSDFSHTSPDVLIESLRVAAYTGLLGIAEAVFPATDI